MDGALTYTLAGKHIHLGIWVTSTQLYIYGTALLGLRLWFWALFEHFLIHKVWHCGGFCGIFCWVGIGFRLRYVTQYVIDDIFSFYVLTFGYCDVNRLSLQSDSAEFIISDLHLRTTAQYRLVDLFVAHVRFSISLCNRYQPAYLWRFINYHYTAWTSFNT